MSRDACLELARLLDVDPDELLEEWSERAAIREFEGGQARPDAERDALDDVRKQHRLVGKRLGPRGAGADAVKNRGEGTGT